MQYLSALKRGQEPPVDPPLKYQLLMISRDLNMSYADVLGMPYHILKDYLDMRELEDEYGPKRAIM